MRILSCLVLLSLISIASADWNTVYTGPYNVTFNLNTLRNYTVEVVAPLEDNDSTAYTILINVSNETRTGIYIRDLKIPEDATLNTIEKIYKASSKDLGNSSVEIQRIDGRDGLIAYYLDPKNRQAFNLIYWTDSKKVDDSSVWIGSTEVKVYGTMPPNESRGWAVVNSLLRTLHIEKAASPASGTTGMAMPAARTSPYINIRNQNVQDQNGVITIDDAFSNGQGKVAIFNDESRIEGGFSIGSADLKDGLNKDVRITVNMAGVVKHPVLYAVMYDQYSHPIGPIYQFQGWPGQWDGSPNWSDHMSRPNEDWL